MPSIAFDPLVSGSPATPSSARLINVPSIEQFSFFTWAKITDYQNWGQLFTIEDGGTSRRLMIEFDASGALKLVRDGSEINYWTDSYTGWAGVGAIGTGADVTGYFIRPGDVWTTTATIVSDPGANTSVGNVTRLFDVDVNGAYLWAGYKVWDVSKTSAGLQEEANYISVIDGAGLSFWNPGDDAATFGIDRGLTGDGDWTQNGTATLSADSAPVAFAPGGGLRVPFTRRPAQVLSGWGKRQMPMISRRGRSFHLNMLATRLHSPSARQISHARPPGPILMRGIPFSKRLIFTRFGGAATLLQGVTVDCDGNPVGAMEVRIYRDSDGAFIGQTTSDGVTGVWAFEAAIGATYQADAWKAGSPNLAGTTGRGLIPF